MTKASDNAFPSILITEGTEPSAPAAGKQRLYIDSTTHLLKATNSSGVDRNIEASAIGGTSVVYKSADESVSNTTLQDDDALLFAIGASERWVVEWNLFVSNAAGTGDFKYNITVPASATGKATGVGATGSASGADNYGRHQGADLGTSGSLGLVASGTIPYTPIQIRAYIENSTNAGNVTLQWAQATTDGSNATIVRKGSWLRATRVV